VGVSEEVIPEARDFLAAVTFGSPASFAALALIQHRQGLGDSRTPMFITLSGNVLNGALGYCLIYGKLGLPALGVSGGGYATATTQWVNALVLLALFVRDVRRAEGKVSLSLPRALREVAQIGMPTGLQFGFEMAAFLTFTSILGSLAPEEIAAHQTSIAIIRTSFLPGFAVAEAGSVLIGQALGRRDVAATGHILKASLVVAGGFMATCGVMFLLLGGGIAHAFTSDEAVARIVVKLLAVAALFQVLDAVNMVLRSALRGAKDVTWPMVIGICVIWTCVPGAAWLLGKHYGMGALGGWCGFIGETTFGASLLALRWRYGGWRRQYEGGAPPRVEEDERDEGPVSVPEVLSA
jgi:MATE family multidrug resistance protein